MPKYIKKAINLLAILVIAKSRLELLLNIIKKLKLFILYLNVKHTENCDLNSGGTILNNDGTTTGQAVGTLNSDNILSLEEQQILDIIERTYNDVLKDLQTQGNTKAIETLYNLTETYTSGYNISHKIIKI